MPTDSVEQWREVDRRRTVYRTTLLALAVVSTVAVLATFFAVFVGLQRLTAIAEVNQRNGSVIASCTTPGGTCYEEGRQRSRDNLAAINEVVVLAAACARNPANTTEAAIRDCVTTGLDRP